ncbi:MAG: hypothetical protein ACKVWV_06815, partial [Planctomycetota bacterium]
MNAHDTHMRSTEISFDTLRARPRRWPRRRTPRMRRISVLSQKFALTKLDLLRAGGVARVRKPDRLPAPSRLASDDDLDL